MTRESSTLGSHPGERVGKYEILKHIANGGMGEVYRARDVESNEEIALKILSKEMALKPAMVERFRREARSAAKLSHENIVRIYDFGESDGKMYIAMEFVEGIDLHEHIENKGKLDPEESRQIMIQAARALAHAAGHAIVHRDIKPSNFLLTRKNGRLLVKLTDMGLAREQDNEQFRVTRAGTTVGTVDYISPEQARDSGVADERSDLYSLGCTWFHMLAGQPPFAKGGLAERLVKHMESPPPDIRKFNSKVSDALIEVLSRLLAKKPDDRYQNAQELVHVLQELNPVRKTAPKSDTVPDLQGRGRHKPGSGTPRKKKGRSTASDHPRPRSRSHTWLIVGIVGVLLLGGIFAAIFLNTPSTGTPNEDPNPRVQVGPGTTTRDQSTVKDRVPEKDALAVKDDNKRAQPPIHQVPPVVVPPKFAPLYKPASPIPVEALAKEYRTPWSQNTEPPADAVVVRVSRSPDGQPGWFPTLAAAVAGTPGEKALIIELHDNGPLPETPIRVQGRSLVLRPGKGFRPLLIWDIPLTVKEQPGSDPLFLITVEKGNLWVSNLEIVTSWPIAQPVRADGFFQVREGDLSLRDLIVSFSSKHETMLLSKVQGSKETRVRFESVHARGDGLAVLDLDANQAEVGFDGCLFVGGKKNLIQVNSADDRKVKLWGARSTFVGHTTLLEVTAPAKQNNPLFEAHWWDCLLTRMGTESRGELLRIPEGATTQNLSWKATNCLVSGWPDLLSGGRRTLSASNVTDWLLLWDRTEGEVIRSNPWPAPTIRDPENKPVDAYRTIDTTMCFASTSDPDRPLGAPLDKLPATRDTWQNFTTERYLLPVVSPLEDSPPEIPAPGDGLYHGEILDLAVTPDIGFHLARQRKFGPRVVLHLKGSGEKPTTPIKMPVGTSLVLYAEPPAGMDPPLALRFVLRAGNDAQALIATERGDLSLFNLEIKPAEGTFVRNPPYLIQTQGGSLKLFRCKLQTPLALNGLKGLLSVQGSGLPEKEKAHSCLLTECVLTCGQTGLHVSGPGVLVAIQKSLAVSGGPIIDFEPGTITSSRLALSCIVEDSTLCSQHAAVAVAPITASAPINEPLVIQSRNCLFLNPFGQGVSPALLHARGSTLADGLILWQSDEDCVDARIGPPILVGENKPAAVHLSTPRAWGTDSQRKLVSVSGLKSTLDPATWTTLDPLVLPPRLPGLVNRRPGADLVEIGAVKKKKP